MDLEIAISDRNSFTIRSALRSMPLVLSRIATKLARAPAGKVELVFVLGRQLDATAVMATLLIEPVVL